MDVTIEIIGWASAVVVTVAYGLMTARRMSSGGVPFHFLNLVGALGLLVNAAYHDALPPVALNGIWALIALRGLIRARSGVEEALPPP
jgi:hypothetical protein